MHCLSFSLAQYHAVINNYLMYSARRSHSPPAELCHCFHWYLSTPSNDRRIYYIQTVSLARCDKWTLRNDWERHHHFCHSGWISNRESSPFEILSLKNIIKKHNIINASIQCSVYLWLVLETIVCSKRLKINMGLYEQVSSPGHFLSLLKGWIEIMVIDVGHLGSWQNLIINVNLMIDYLRRISLEPLPIIAKVITTAYCTMLTMCGVFIDVPDVNLKVLFVVELKVKNLNQLIL